MTESLNQRVITSATDGRALTLGPIGTDQFQALFELFSDVVERGEGFPHQPPLTQEAFEDVWGKRATIVIAAMINDQLAGAYYMKPNLPGLASHIANAGYVVAQPFRGKGIGRCMVQDSIARAPLAGFNAVQFNFVFADNPARAMYEQLGWQVIGKVPDGVGPGRDAIVYWRRVP